MKRSLSLLLFSAVLVGVAGLCPTLVQAQGLTPWTAQQTIPDFHPETEPPLLIADQARTVHAFSSQWLPDDGGPAQLAILYNQWSAQNGWTPPTDILLSPLRGQAWIMDGFLDATGTVHLLIFSGDDVEAEIYYTHAPLSNASNTHAWADPILVGPGAQTPKSASIATDGQGNMVILYGGRLDGFGVYTVYSADNGASWSVPEPIYFTNSGDLKAHAIQISKGASGWLHTIWAVVSAEGQGRTIYYSQQRLGERVWSAPVPLAEAPSGLGVMTPTIIEHNDTVFAIFNRAPKVVMRRSSDYGATWSEIIEIFDQHVGVNGTISLVVDGNGDLHQFWGQRITGNPDIHGMWHSIWRGGAWTPPEPLVSGPQINDVVGDTAFDPYDARAVVSQGDTILTTWRSDPGNKGNGVWYSYQQLNAPAQPEIALPTPLPTPTVTPTQTPITPTATPTRPAALLLNRDTIAAAPATNAGNAPAFTLLISMIPALLIVVALLARSYFVQLVRR
jgi:hypothetical protein